MLHKPFLLLKSLIWITTSKKMRDHFHECISEDRCIRASSIPEVLQDPGILEVVILEVVSQTVCLGNVN